MCGPKELPLRQHASDRITQPDLEYAVGALFGKFVNRHSVRCRKREVIHIHDQTGSGYTLFIAGARYMITYSLTKYTVTPIPVHDAW